jgi:hypothetical protein
MEPEDPTPQPAPTRSASLVPYVASAVATLLVVGAFVGLLFWPFHHDWGEGEIGVPDHRISVHLKTRWQGWRLDYIFTVRAAPADLAHYKQLTFLLQDSGGFTIYQREVDVDRELGPSEARGTDSREFVVRDATALGPMAYSRAGEWSAGFIER